MVPIYNYILKYSYFVVFRSCIMLLLCM